MKGMRERYDRYLSQRVAEELEEARGKLLYQYQQGQELQIERKEVCGGDPKGAVTDGHGDVGEYRFLFGGVDGS